MVFLLESDLYCFYLFFLESICSISSVWLYFEFDEVLGGVFSLMVFSDDFLLIFSYYFLTFMKKG